ncbi:MAG: inositol monophosphatase [Verrucomicrobiales bacterium]|jgi:myo-inositol-1(or 4)-monophosphatase|nr:inositol monophosphatase [Verrucomicrobiales bacterium]
MNLTLLLQTAEAAARLAGAALKKAFGGEVVVNEARHHDLKIQLDKDTQALLVEFLLRQFPASAILGEEGGAGSGGRGVEWILDPIDGTVNLAYGLPHFCVSVACRVEGDLVAGAIYDPLRDELFKAAVGRGATLNGKTITVSGRAKLEEAIMAIGFSKTAQAVEKCLELQQYYARRARKLRALGSAALDLAYIAAGRMDAYLEQSIQIWDIAAGVVILREAGGKIDLAPLPGRPNVYHACAWNGVLELPRR